MNDLCIKSDVYIVKNEMVMSVVSLNRTGVNVAAVTAVTAVTLVAVSHSAVVDLIVLAVAVFGFTVETDLLVETSVTVKDAVAIVVFLIGVAV